LLAIALPTLFDWRWLVADLVPDLVNFVEAIAFQSCKPIRDRKRFWKRLLIILAIWIVVLPIGFLSAFALIGLNRLRLATARRGESFRRI